jgi:hypothetical protein
MNPNKAFKATFKDPELRYKAGKMMTEDQREIIERLCNQHDISLIRLTTRTLGFRKKVQALTHIDAARCIMIAAVWENYRKRGDEP